MTKHRFTTLFALFLAVLAVALPSAASAATAEQILGAPAGSEGQAISSESTPGVASDDSGFGWSDAAVGAGVALGLVAVGAGGAIMLRSMRSERREVRLTS